MCCESLICARCASPVADAGCPTCRASRDRLHGPGTVLPPQVVALLLALAALLALLATQVR
jgi:hypothetical protein